MKFGDYWLGGSAQSIPQYATAEGAVIPMERPKPVYVVSGFMRSGTSMMMKALEAGGMEAVYRQSRDVMKNRFADAEYDPNIGGLFELERTDYQKPDFPHGYEGKLIKALRMGPGRMAVTPGGIRVVFMRRDPEEIRQSYMAFFGRSDFTVEQIEADVGRSLVAARNRRDTRVLEVWYRGVVENPRLWFERIRKFYGVPLDVDAAAAVVSDEWLRYRKEELEVGVV